MIMTAGMTFLGLVLMLASIPWITEPGRVSVPISNVEPATSTINAVASLGEDGALTVFIGVSVDRGSTADPVVEIVMPAHQMSAPVNLISAGPGAFEARTILPMVGDWEVRIHSGSELTRLLVRW